MDNKFAWISTPDELWDDKKEMITTALESGIDHVLDLDDIENIRKLGNVKIIANSKHAQRHIIFLILGIVYALIFFIEET